METGVAMFLTGRVNEEGPSFACFLSLKMGGRHGQMAETKVLGSGGSFQISEPTSMLSLDLQHVVYSSQDPGELSYSSEFSGSPTAGTLTSSTKPFMCFSWAIDVVAEFNIKCDVQGMAFSSNAKHLVIGGPAGFAVFDWEAGRQVSKTPLDSKRIPQCVALCPSMQTAVSGMKDGTLLYCKYDSGQVWMCLSPSHMKCPCALVTNHGPCESSSEERTKTSPRNVCDVL